jgi:hypothetical protein
MYSLCESRLPPNLSFFNPVTPGPKRPKSARVVAFHTPNSFPSLLQGHAFPQPQASWTFPPRRRNPERWPSTHFSLTVPKTPNQNSIRRTRAVLGERAPTKIQGLHRRRSVKGADTSTLGLGISKAHPQTLQTDTDPEAWVVDENLWSGPTRPPPSTFWRSTLAGELLRPSETA